MKNGICPKCSSQEVYTSEKLRNKSGAYNSNTIPLSFFRSIPLDNFVCIDCGYVESYIAEEAMLARIQDIWERVDKQQ